MTVFSHPEFDQHESVHQFQDDATGLRCIIAIHSTALGPAAGGCRRWTYQNDADAMTDALRLSKGMTYKNAVAGLNFGGGKSVILANDGAPKSDALFRAFGRAVDALGGRYVTAEDVGISVDDMRWVNQSTPYVSGLPQDGTDAGGDPSPWTALGVYLGLEAAVKERLGRDNLAGLKVAVQGVGNVGFHLCELLHKADAQLVIADVNPVNLQRVTNTMPATVVSPEDILFTDVDALSPCALGAILSDKTIPKLRSKVIAGAANNQLATHGDGALLTQHDILYAPDYVINAGGIISVAHEYEGKTTSHHVQADIEQIPGRLRDIFAEAKSTGKHTHDIADELARRIVANGNTPTPALAQA
ncbi:MAG: Glu/Leu/Phe/Val dehydrogenase dimerization domain-containing protein [Pseudomonadota bacterium]